MAKKETTAKRITPPGPAALKRGRQDMAARCQAVANAIAKEAGVKKVEYHESGLRGRAWAKEKRISVPRPTTRRRLYIFAHECAHLRDTRSAKKRSKPQHREEYEAELWAHDALRRHGIAVPNKSTETAKKYVAHKIHQAVRRRAKSIDHEALEWCKGYHTPTVKKWLQENPQPRPAKQSPTKTVTNNRQTREEDSVTALITQGADVAKLVGRDRDDLAKWFNLYLGVEEDPGSHTHRAKVGDIQWFLRFFYEDAGGYHCDDWTKSRTKAFSRWIRKQTSEKTGNRLASSTCSRIFDTIKHAARWIHRQRPFLAGDPFADVKGIALEEPSWQGLTDLEVRRLKAAAEQLQQLHTSANQLPLRNNAILLTLLDSGLRVFELAALQLSQYRRRALHDIQRKGDKVTNRIPLSPDTCEALDRYIDEERQQGAGPLFQSKNGNPLAQQDVDYLLRRIASQANSRLPAKDQIELSPHVLRHTALRKWTEKKGVQFAQKIAGHASQRYIWRYVTPSESDMDQAAESLWE